MHPRRGVHPWNGRDNAEKVVLDDSVAGLLVPTGRPTPVWREKLGSITTVQKRMMTIKVQKGHLGRLLREWGGQISGTSLVKWHLGYLDDRFWLLMTSNIPLDGDIAKTLSESIKHALARYKL